MCPQARPAYVHGLPPLLRRCTALLYAALRCVALRLLQHAIRLMQNAINWLIEQQCPAAYRLPRWLWCRWTIARAPPLAVKAVAIGGRCAFGWACGLVFTACLLGRLRPVNWVLSLEVFVPVAALSYSAYILQAGSACARACPGVHGSCRVPSNCAPPGTPVLRMQTGRA